MKKIIFRVALIATALVQNVFAQDSPNTQLIHSYYDIKNALVAGNANTASIKAAEFVKTLQSIDSNTIHDAARGALLKDAGDILENKDLKHQREHFTSFSTNMYTLAKTVKLTDAPVYYAYCPMKKAHWLSNEPAIRNPYFGSAMLTCGKVEETLK